MRCHWLVIALLSVTVNAKNLGVVGQTYPIAEMDMLDWIQLRLRQMQQTGELDQIEATMKAQVTASATRPPPVKGLTTTNTPQVFYLDPTLTLQQDITDHTGKVLFAKGLRINPFDANTWPQGSALPPFMLTKALFFLDGDDGQRVRFAKRYLAQQAAQGQKIKWVLVNGEPNNVSEQLGERVYFDQGGHITRQLTLKHVPSVARQAGTQWQITEMDVSRENPAPLTPGE
ncbi:type-F conjugative transfer system protein TraW [Photobacterium leiognathi]|uniref:type-F conjugative transfer system protein TraW n=1 Tax=Photobacterium leiognathi TaxID=553611 RepID=UPI0027385742|nr:type-F conjugative transfer system protein TraW [Photobacterium leiognathi]